MKRTTLLMTMMLLVLFGLTACERPAPGSQQIPATATTTAPLPGMTLLPPAGASPTPALGATLDPSLQLPSDATPTLDPALQPVTEPTAPVIDPTAEPTAASTGEIIHIVVAGDNLYRIGLQYGFTYQELAIYNGLTNPDRLDIGQQIKIPPRP